MYSSEEWLDVTQALPADLRNRYQVESDAVLTNDKCLMTKYSAALMGYSFGTTLNLSYKSNGSVKIAGSKLIANRANALESTIDASRFGGTGKGLGFLATEAQKIVKRFAAASRCY